MSVPAAVYNVTELQKEFEELSLEFKDLEVRQFSVFQSGSKLDKKTLTFAVCESRISGITGRIRGSSDKMYKKYKPSKIPHN